MTNKTIIGVFYYTDDCEFVTVDDLLRLIAMGGTTYTMADYTDRRKSTNITRFNFDPFTGEKVEWGRMRKRYIYKS